MKTIALTTVLPALFFILFACKKDDNYCVKNISIKYDGSVGVVSFTLPGGDKYSGQGALPHAVTFGKHAGKFQSVVTKQTPGPTGMDVELVHYFDDGKGNAFWTSDKATFTPLDTTFTRFQVYDVMTIVDGTGDFECASGQLINEGPADFSTGILKVNMTGEVCGGCD